MGCLGWIWVMQKHFLCIPLIILRLNDYACIAFTVVMSAMFSLSPFVSSLKLNLVKKLQKSLRFRKTTEGLTCHWSERRRLLGWREWSSPWWRPPPSSPGPRPSQPGSSAHWPSCHHTRPAWPGGPSRSSRCQSWRRWTAPWPSRQSPAPAVITVITVSTKKDGGFLWGWGPNCLKSVAEAGSDKKISFKYLGKRWKVHPDVQT